MRKLLAVLLVWGVTLAQFGDLTPQDPGWQAINALAEMGVIFGYPDGNFRPMQGVTRREVALMLYRLWLNAQAAQDALLLELSQELAQFIADIDLRQAALDEAVIALEQQLAQLEAAEAEALAAEVAALRGSSVAIEESLSILARQLENLQRASDEALARAGAAEQRAATAMEDAVIVQQGFDTLRREVESELGEALTALRGIEQRFGAQLASSASALQGQIRTLEQQLATRDGELSERFSELDGQIAELERQLIGVREEVFETADAINQTREELARAQEELPSPLALQGGVAGISPLILSFAASHDSLLFGAGVRAGIDWRQDIGEFGLQVATFLPIVSGPVRGQAGVGSHYNLSGEFAGRFEIMGLLGLGVEVFGGFEGFGELRMLFPLDGDTPRGRFGVGVRVRF